LGIDHFSASAKTGKNVEEIFRFISVRKLSYLKIILFRNLVNKNYSKGRRKK